jgi:hypothetical protein
VVKSKESNRESEQKDGAEKAQDLDDFFHRGEIMLDELHPWRMSARAAPKRRFLGYGKNHLDRVWVTC